VHSLAGLARPAAEKDARAEDAWLWKARHATAVTAPTQQVAGGRAVRPAVTQRWR